MEAIIHTKNELRPCMVTTYSGIGMQTKREEKKAFFHKFITRAQPIAPSVVRGGHNGGQVIAPYALIELENGTVHEVETRDIRFLDTKERMAQYAWGDKEKQEAGLCETCKHYRTSLAKAPCCSCEDQNGFPDHWEARARK